MQLAKQGSLFQAAKPATAKKDTEHVYRPDGLLEVNPKGKHPIVELIERSDAQWKSKLDRQSKTLTQAVTEYRRRYKRSPPKGFEHWWNFVKTHNVKLVDEYDSIHEKFQPFWGVDPAALNKSQAILETLPDRFTIGKLPGEHSVKLLNQTFRKESRSGEHRIRDQLDLLESVQEWLPDFRATFSMHDGPTQVVGWELYSKAKEAAERGEYIDVEQVAASISAKGWAAACPPNAPIQSYDPPPLPAATLEATQPPAPPERLESPKPKSFIHDHNLSMSPCFHPSHMHLNGFLSRFHYRHQFGPEPTAFFTPTFSICVSPLHRDILTVAPEQYRDDVDEDPVWGDKVDTRLLWRGSNTGIAHGEGNDWNTSQRTRLVELGTRRGGETQVLLPPGGRAGDVSGWDAAAVGHGEPVRTSALNAAFMDVAFVGKPIQCDKSVCSQLQRMFEWRPFQPWRDAWVYKFIMDIDGNGWSARFKRLMTSKSLIFKSTIFPEWYTERIMPWVHYIPVQMDLSDIYDVLAFFRGDLSGAGAHDDLAERIATAGKTWSHEFYRRHDMAAYNIRLFLEYARVMSLDREAMTYKDGDEDGLDRR
ncbi:glycosyl transferase family 90-domain-containing protein [Gautieria morchelliformis]|nr:glycosyl transferase family 90-domain-containing protein [Gautieria morchelliformis]